MIDLETVLFADAPFEIIDGDRGKNYPKHSEFNEGGYCLFLSATNVTKSGFEFTSCQFIDRKRDEALNKGKLRRGDIVLTTRGTIGNTAYYNDTIPFENVRINSGMVILRCDPSKLLPAFLYQFVRSPRFFSQVNGLRSGVAQPQLPIRDMRQIRLPLPPLPIQRRIAGILSAYDELIENSQRRIKILESMARGLYREWFVHFRFPGHESVPRVKSPLGEIPEGWEVKPFGEIYNTSSGGTPSRKRPEYFEGGSIDWVKSQELLDKFILSTEERITADAVANSSAKVFPPNTVLVALYGATIGMLAIISGEAATNQACCAVLPKSSAYGREFAFLTLLTNRERIIGLRLGAAQQNISQVLLRNFECIKPPTEIATQFAEHVSPLFDGILNLQLQIENLRRTRDLLLPRLMTGQINLEDSNG